MKKTGLVIPVYNRPFYVQQCFDSIEALDKMPDVIVVVDDGSDSETKKIISSFAYNTNAHIITNQTNKGITQALLKGIEYAFSKGCHAVINLDSDSVVKPDFIQRLNVYGDKHIVSGFNCHHATNKPVRVENDYALKPFCNGINMRFTKLHYEKYIKPMLSQNGNWDSNVSLLCQVDKLPFIITTPSVVQHIGMYSSLGHNHQEPDRAEDFKFLSLPDVTLFGIDPNDAPGLLRASNISQRDIEFGAVKMITERHWPVAAGREGYSKFIMKELDKHFTTSHVLIIHPDGYVLNWQAWQNEWLQYDYIGATWWYKDNMNVGNGGFSLRSKKLQHILATTHFDQFHPEDHHICRTYRDDLERRFGIKFAPEEVANRFSIEAYAAPKPANEYGGQFGFHSVHVDLSTAPDYGVSPYILYKKSK